MVSMILLFVVVGWENQLENAHKPVLKFRIIFYELIGDVTHE